MLPENADSWSCNKPVDEEKVFKGAKCKLVCLDGHDSIIGKRNYDLLVI